MEWGSSVGYAPTQTFLTFWIKMVRSGAFCACFYRVTHMHRKGIALYTLGSGVCLSVCLSVCHKVTSRCFINTAERIITQSTENRSGHFAITSLDL